MTWDINDRVVYARHLPDEPNVWRNNDDRDIGRLGAIDEIDHTKTYGYVAYRVIWDAPIHAHGAIGRWCAAEQLDAVEADLPGTPRP